MSDDTPHPNGNAAADFIEKVGRHFEAEGFSRIAGRILGFMLLQTEPRSLDELADSLQVSKASVSSNTRFLEGFGALERVTLPGDRRDYYRLADRMHERMLDLRVKSLRSIVELLAEGRATAPARDAAVRARMQDMSIFFEHMIDAIRETRQRWEREHGEVEG